jgi:hypothetical protein
MTSEVIEEHRSPDGLLRLVVMRYEDGDIAIGFDGYPWHHHPEHDAAATGVSIDEAVRHFIDLITSNQELIAISRVNGVIQNVWPANDPAGDLKHMPSEETIEFRWWNPSLPRKPRSGGS